MAYFSFWFEVIKIIILSFVTSQEYCPYKIVKNTQTYFAKILFLEVSSLLNFTKCLSDNDENLFK